MTRAKAMEQWVYITAVNALQVARWCWIINGFTVAHNRSRRRSARLKHSLTQITIKQMVRL